MLLFTIDGVPRFASYLISALVPRRAFTVGRHYRCPLSQKLGADFPKPKKMTSREAYPTHGPGMSSVTHRESLDVEVVYAGELHEVARVKGPVPEDEGTEKEKRKQAKM